MTTPSAARRHEIVAGLEAARSRIRAAEDAAGRIPGSVGLVVVTKTFPAAEVKLLADLGVRDVGENKDQEAAAKAAEVADDRLVWHFIGQLQSNKARSVAGYAAVVESVDRPKLVRVLDRAAGEVGRPVDCLVQVSLDLQPGRGGASPGDAPALVDQIASAEWLRARGVMAVAPLGSDPDAAFAELRKIAEAVRSSHPRADIISAGMSGDLEAAIRHGATHVRLGSAILGYRPPVG